MKQYVIHDLPLTESNNCEGKWNAEDTTNYVCDGQRDEVSPDGDCRFIAHHLHSYDGQVA